METDELQKRNPFEEQIEKIATVLQKIHFQAQETFSEQEAADYLHCSMNALKRYSLRTHQIKYCLVGRNRVYRKADLDKFLLSVRR